MRAEKVKEKALEDLEKRFASNATTSSDKPYTPIPRLFRKPLKRVTLIHPRRRLEEYDTATEAYQESSMVKVAIEEVIADQFCQDQLAPVVTAYEDEKARIFGDEGGNYEE